MRVAVAIELTNEGRATLESYARGLHGLSAHADRTELIRWLRGMRSAPRAIFAVHGEPALVLAESVPTELGSLLRRRDGDFGRTP
jgi:predicted metal-dependent RNase